MMQPTPFDQDKDTEQAWKDFVFHVGRAGLSAQQGVTLLNELAETLTGAKKYSAELGPASRCMVFASGHKYRAVSSSSSNVRPQTANPDDMCQPIGRFHE